MLYFYQIINNYILVTSLFLYNARYYIKQRKSSKRNANQTKKTKFSVFFIFKGGYFQLLFLCIMSLTLNITYNKTKIFNFLLISTFFSRRLISYLRKFLTMHFKQSHLHPKHSPQMSYDREYPQRMYLCSCMYYFSSKVSTGFFQNFSITRTAFIDCSFKASWLRIIKGFLIFFTSYL